MNFGSPIFMKAILNQTIYICIANHVTQSFFLHLFHWEIQILQPRSTSRSWETLLETKLRQFADLDFYRHKIYLELWTPYFEVILAKRFSFTFNVSVYNYDLDWPLKKLHLKSTPQYLSNTCLMKKICAAGGKCTFICLLYHNT